MEIKPTRLLYYNKTKHLNDTPYGNHIIRHAWEWANLLEDKLCEYDLTEQKSIVEYLRDHAEQISFNTKTCEGLSGYQHDCATSLLIKTWKHGFELWLGICLDRYRNKYYLTEEQKEYIKYWLSGDYDNVNKYKRECDGTNNIDNNTTWIIGARYNNENLQRKQKTNQEDKRIRRTTPNNRCSR